MVHGGLSSSPYSERFSHTVLYLILPTTHASPPTPKTIGKVIPAVDLLHLCALLANKATYQVEFKDGGIEEGVPKGRLREFLGRVLIGKCLVHDTGDPVIDSAMASYRRAVDKRVLRGQLEDDVGVEDDLSVVSGMTVMNRNMFMSDDKPRFGDFVGHIRVTDEVREDMRNREGIKEKLERKKKRIPKMYDMSKTLDFIEGIQGLDEKDKELVREVRG